MEIVELSTTLSVYGLYGIVAILAGIVVKIYRDYQALEKEVRIIYSGELGNVLKVVTEATSAIQRCTEATQKSNESLQQVLISVSKMDARMTEIADQVSQTKHAKISR